MIKEEIIAAGAAVMEEYAGGDYLKWRYATVMAWAAMNRAADGKPPNGGDTFMLAYERNLEKMSELKASAAKIIGQHAARAAAAQQHGLAPPSGDEDPLVKAEREWNAWLKVNG